ncbi:uncharacterized protein LOC114393520 [Glycine soja]|nr:uncharacterized protein LOC114393520 [Glycine soja]
MEAHCLFTSKVVTPSSFQMFRLSIYAFDLKYVILLGPINGRETHLQEFSSTPKTKFFFPLHSSTKLVSDYPKSRDSIMESKAIDNTIKILYSYGGKILPRHTDAKLRYYGGHTRVLSLHPSTSFSELILKLTELCASPVTLKCPLPNGDLDTLISVTSDEDLANIIHLYDRASSSLPHRLKIRAILSPPKKLSPSPSSPSSSAAHSPSGGSPHSAADSLPCPAAHQFVRRKCSPVPVAYPISVRSGAAKGCMYTRQLDGSPRFLYRGVHWNNYCH